MLPLSKDNYQQLVTRVVLLLADPPPANFTTDTHPISFAKPNFWLYRLNMAVAFEPTMDFFLLIVFRFSMFLQIGSNTFFCFVTESVNH